jgi:thiol-disulfide isomerase/thioredoxin
MRFKSSTPSVTRFLQTSAMLAGLICGLATVPTRAETLTIGSPAPAIDVEHWFHDYEPVTAFEKGKVYVVEFWATWCGPCVASMPRLAEIQERFPDDVVIISISSEEPAKIEEFLDRKKGDTTYREITSAYRLATDPDRSVNNDYMRAAGQNGIPTAFLVGKTGEIEWIGHPMRMDEPVAKVIAGQWDRDAFAVEFEEEKLVRRKTQQLGRLVQQKKFTEALAGLDAIMADVKSEAVRTRLGQTRRSLQMQADAHQRREEQEAKAASKQEVETMRRLLDTAFLLDAGKRDEAIAELGKLAEEAKTPQIQTMLRQAVMKLKQKIELAAEVE